MSRSAAAAQPVPPLCLASAAGVAYDEMSTWIKNNVSCSNCMHVHYASTAQARFRCSLSGLD